MAIFRHTTPQINDYFERQGINQSALKVLIKDGIQAFVDQKDQLMRSSDLFYEEKRYFIIGSGVDMKLTQTKEEFEESYFVSQLIKKPGPKTMSVIHRAYELAKEAFPEGPDADIKLYRKQLFIACNEEVYRMGQAKSTTKGEVTYTTWENDDSRLNSILKENGAAYWVDLCVAEGKQILSDDEATTITTIEMAFKTHPHTAWLFKDSDTVDLIYQMPIYFTVDEVDCKIMIDCIRIDHTAKKVMDIDFKTLGDYIIKFPAAVNYRRYDIQGAFYHEGTKQGLTAISELIGKDVTGYTVSNFAFAAESSIRPGTPLIYVLKQDMMDRGKNGSTTVAGVRYVGYVEAIAKYKQWAELGFSLNKRFEPTNGIILLGTDYDMNINI